MNTVSYTHYRKTIYGVIYKVSGYCGTTLVLSGYVEVRNYPSMTHRCVTASIYYNPNLEMGISDPRGLGVIYHRNLNYFNLNEISDEGEMIKLSVFNTYYEMTL